MFTAQRIFGNIARQKCQPMSAQLLLSKHIIKPLRRPDCNNIMSGNKLGDVMLVLIKHMHALARMHDMLCTPYCAFVYLRRCAYGLFNVALALGNTLARLGNAFQVS